MAGRNSHGLKRHGRCRWQNFGGDLCVWADQVWGYNGVGSKIIISAATLLAAAYCGARAANLALAAQLYIQLK